jgi:toxin ParE1/3/4
MRLRWTRAALANLNDLAEYIARDNPRAAAEMIDRIFAALDGLLAHPAMGRPGRVANTRELVVPKTPYILPYRVKGQYVEILRVFHGARRWPDDF